MSRTYQISCHECGTPFEQTTARGIAAARELAAQEGWTVNLPAWHARRPMVATPGRKERRIDFCRPCMDKKTKDDYYAAMSTIQSAAQGTVTIEPAIFGDQE